MLRREVPAMANPADWAKPTHSPIQGLLSWLQRRLWTRWPSWLASSSPNLDSY